MTLQFNPKLQRLSSIATIDIHPIASYRRQWNSMGDHMIKSKRNQALAFWPVTRMDSKEFPPISYLYCGSSKIIFDLSMADEACGKKYLLPFVARCAKKEI